MDILILFGFFIVFSGLSKQAVDVLVAKYNNIVAELEKTAVEDEVLVELQETHEFYKEQLKQYERELPLLKKDVNDLSEMNKVMIAECNAFRNKKLLQ